MINISAFAKNSVRPRKNTADGGCGVNSAVFLQKIEASPTALLVKAMHHRKILFSLREEKIGRAQNEKSKEYFSVVPCFDKQGGGAGLYFLQEHGGISPTPPFLLVLAGPE